MGLCIGKTTVYTKVGPVHGSGQPLHIPQGWGGTTVLVKISLQHATCGEKRPNARAEPPLLTKPLLSVKILIKTQKLYAL